MAEPRYKYGGDSAIGAFLLPERREILRDEQNQFIGYDDQGNAIVQTIPAQYGESEVDVSYSPVVRGAQKTLSFIRDAFSGDPERVGSAADRAETAIRGVMGGLTDYASSQYEAGMAGGTIYDPETGQITEFDPALVMGGSGAGKSLPRSALDMSDAARMQRAQELGFDTSRPLYHYTDKLEDGGEFNRLAVSPDNVQTKLGRGIYTSPNNQYGDRYVRQQREMSGAYGENARAIPLYARGNLATDVDFDAAMRAARENLGIQGRRVPDRESKLRLSNEIRSEAQRLLKDQGFSGIQFMDEVMIFDPKDVRSVNARFDPAMSNSDMIMYSGGGRQGTAIAGGSALRGLDMSAGARMQRAQDLGFDTSRIAYRGIREEYNPEKTGYYQMFTSSSQDAKEYGENVISAYTRRGNNLSLDAGKTNYNDIPVEILPENVRKHLHYTLNEPNSRLRTDDIAHAAREAGYDSVTINNIFDKADNEIPMRPLSALNELDQDMLQLLDEVNASGTPDNTPSLNTLPKTQRNYDPTTIDIIFDPKNIRSTEAEFDPTRTDSADLLSSRQSERRMSALRGIA